jgi:hypothetical protein
MFRNCIIISSLLASGLQASILNGGFESGNLTDYSVDANSNVTTTPVVLTPSAYQVSDPAWFLAFPTAPEGSFYAMLSNGPGAVNSGLTDVSILDTIAYFVNSPTASLGFTYDFLTGDGQGDFFQVNVLHGGVATQLLLVPDSGATNNITTGACVSAPDDIPTGTIVCSHTGLTTFTTAANALAAFNGQQVQFQFLVSDGGADDAFDSAAVLDAINGTGLDVERLTTVVPEPGTILLAAGALAALALRKLRS